MRISINRRQCCFGAPCDHFKSFDYNLSNVKIKYEKEIEDCDEGSFKTKNKEIIIKLETIPLIPMHGLFPGSNKINFTNSETTIFLNKILLAVKIRKLIIFHMLQV